MEGRTQHLKVAHQGTERGLAYLPLFLQSTGLSIAAITKETSSIRAMLTEEKTTAYDD